MDQPRRHSPAVYRRRRLIAALLAVALLALAVWGTRVLIDQFTSDDSEPSADTQTQDQDDAEDAQSPAPEPTPTEDDDPDDDDPGDSAEDLPEDGCSADDIEVRASTNEDSFEADVAPLLIMEIENIGDEECTIDVGTDQQVFTVSYSGSEIFNTDECDGTGDSLEMDFEPGQTESAQLVWPRSDSSEDCTEPTELFTGDYEFTASVSGVVSDEHTFHITGVEQ